MTVDGERIAKLEESLRVIALEVSRCRERLHMIEGEALASKAASAALAEAQRERRKATEERIGNRREIWKVRIQAVGVAVAAIAIALPLIERVIP